jgi:hypothetical protein
MENWTIENFMIVGQAILKMSAFFGPILLVGVVMIAWSEREEAK